VPDPVNPREPSVREAQTSQTEERIVAAASELFLARGYQATTLTDVADLAGVGSRTVYVRFGTKAALFARVVDVAIAGDTAPIPLLDRPDQQGPFSGPDADHRVAEFCHAGAQIMRRTGPLFAVAQEAAMIDPVLQSTWQSGREGTRHSHKLFWKRLSQDGLLDPSINTRWLIDTTTVLGAAETFLLTQNLYRWKIPAYERWLVASYRRLARLD
jgi:AcrR family transcriptional regulator